MFLSCSDNTPLYSSVHRGTHTNMHFSIYSEHAFDTPLSQRLSPVKVNPCCQKQYRTKCSDPFLCSLTLGVLVIRMSGVFWGLQSLTCAFMSLDACVNLHFILTKGKLLRSVSSDFRNMKSKDIEMSR